MKKSILLLGSVLWTSYSIGQTLDASGFPSSAVQDKKVKSETLRTAHPPVIAHVIPSPVGSSYLSDIAFDGQQLWVCGYNEFLIHRVLRSTGAITKSITNSRLRPGGLAFDGTNLWLAESDLKLIEKIDTTTGAVILSFAAPRDSSISYPNGLACDGSTLWNNDPGAGGFVASDSTFQFTNSGLKLQGYIAKGNYPTGLEFDGLYLWSCDNIVRYIYKIDPSTFTIIDTIDAPGGDYPNGLAYDGQYLWVANNDSDSIYALDVSMTAGLNDQASKKAGFKSFPNPFNNSTTITFDKQLDNAVLYVYNALGLEVKRFTAGSVAEIHFDREELPAGIYFFSVFQNNELVGKDKLIITK